MAEENPKAEEQEKPWEVTTERYVAFFDIMGFKERVASKSHDEILAELKILKKHLEVLETVRFNINDEDYATKIKTVIFSDSVLFFTEDSSKDSLATIAISSSYLLCHCLLSNIPIKGALSFGNISVDIDNSIYFGKPIIDSYLLQEELAMYGVVLDHKIENKLKEYGLEDLGLKLSDLFSKGKIKFKSGIISHYTIDWCSAIDDYIETEELVIKNVEETIKEIYLTVSGRPRIYMDNTIEYFEKNYTPKKAEKKEITTPQS